MTRTAPPSVLLDDPYIPPSAERDDSSPQRDPHAHARPAGLPLGRAGRDRPASEIPAPDAVFPTPAVADRTEGTGDCFRCGARGIEVSAVGSIHPPDLAGPHALRACAGCVELMRSEQRWGVVKLARRAARAAGAHVADRGRARR
jgi:hypothetical protein